MSGGSIMGPPIPTMAELLRFAEKLLTDRAMTREELIKIGLLSDKYVN
jgi:hypothetical protein